MNQSKLKKFTVIAVVAGLLAWGAFEVRLQRSSSAAPAVVEATPKAEDPADIARAAREMAESATNFWNALTPEQQAKASYEMKDPERRDWNFVPLVRKGLTIKEMTSGQRALAHAFLASGLSMHGYQQAVTIMSLDDILKAMENGKGPVRDPELYYFTVFGKPGPTETWGWRVEGHHLSLNFTIADGQAVAAGPVFYGANPAEVRQGPRKGLRVLGVTEDLGRQLIKDLSEEQRKTAIIDATAPKEIITGNQRKANPGEPKGLPAGAMNPEQKEQLVKLVGVFANRLRPELAQQDLDKIEKAGWDKVHFAWAGGLEPGEKHYYRIHGPTFLVEYDNTQNDANHIHTVWRDSANDFGEDILKEHYEADHAGAGK
jgi:hypothetical protein